MTATGLWQDIGLGRISLPNSSASSSCLRGPGVLLPGRSSAHLAATAVLGLLILVLSMGLSRSSDSYLITLSLMMMSIFCTFRYGFWRITETVRFFTTRPTIGARWTHSSS